MSVYPTIKNYAQAAAYLGDKQDRPLHGKATRIKRISSGHIAIYYHRTAIVIYDESGIVWIKSEGYQTVTTKRKINEYSPAMVWSKRGIWYVSVAGQKTRFHDNMQVWPTLELNPQEDTADQDDKAIKAYVKEYVNKLVSMELIPSGGDCWLCSMKTDPAHIKLHIEEKYYTPNLISYACQNAGLSQIDRLNLLLWQTGNLAEKQIYPDLTERRVRSILLNFLRAAYQ